MVHFILGLVNRNCRNIKIFIHFDFGGEEPACPLQYQEGNGRAGLLASRIFCNKLTNQSSGCSSSTGVFVLFYFTIVSSSTE